MTVRTVLAIETSCDETAAAVVRGREVCSDVVASQLALHAPFGGVVPEMASRRHLEQLDDVVRAALDDAGVDHVSSLDAIAVTQGPGLVGALLVGLAGAKARAWAGGVPLIPVDHLLGHVASAMLAPDALEPPYLCLLVSGGHTLALDVGANLELQLLGTTRDDAAGEAFDKGARLLGLDPPSGARLAELAATWVPAPDAEPLAFTPAMVHHDSLDTSFSGIKTALSVAVGARAARGSGTPTDAQLADAYETAIVETVAGSVNKLLRRRGPRSGHADARDTLAVVGGVAANEKLRARMAEICIEHDAQCVHAPLRWCGDNAVMIGIASAWCDEQPAQDAWLVDAYATSPLFRRVRSVPN